VSGDRHSYCDHRSLPDATKDVGIYLVNDYNQELPHTFNGGISPIMAEGKLNMLSKIS